MRSRYKTIAPWALFILLAQFTLVAICYAWIPCRPLARMFTYDSVGPDIREALSEDQFGLVVEVSQELCMYPFRALVVASAAWTVFAGVLLAWCTRTHGRPISAADPHPGEG